MKVINIATDRKIFDESSAVRKRAVEYGTLFEELHIVVFSKSSLKLEAWRIADNVWIYPTNSLSRFLYIYDATKLAKKIIGLRKLDSKNTVISTQDPFETGSVGLRLKNIFNIPLQVQVHTDFLSKYFYSLSFLNKIRVKLAKNILPQADRIRVVSQRIKYSLISAQLVEEKKISVLPIFVDPGQFIIGDTVSDTLQKKYPQFSFIILMASRLTKEKNISCAIQAMKEVVTKFPKAGLIIVGEGPEDKNIKKQIQNLNLIQNVILEPWHTSLVAYYKSAHAFLLTSLYEGYGMTLVEAGLSGAAIITSDVGIVGEILKDNKNALIFEVNKTYSLVQKILMLLDNNILRMQLKAAIVTDINANILKDKQEYLKRYKESMTIIP
jgi:glycosyltransferase involved in cell wall biosynthesis